MRLAGCPVVSSRLDVSCSPADRRKGAAAAAVSLDRARGHDTLGARLITRIVCIRSCPQSSAAWEHLDGASLFCGDVARPRRRRTALRALCRRRVPGGDSLPDLRGCVCVMLSQRGLHCSPFDRGAAGELQDDTHTLRPERSRLRGCEGPQRIRPGSLSPVCLIRTFPPFAHAARLARIPGYFV